MIDALKIAAIVWLCGLPVAWTVWGLMIVLDSMLEPAVLSRRDLKFGLLGVVVWPVMAVLFLTLLWSMPLCVWLEASEDEP